MNGNVEKQENKKTRLKKISTMIFSVLMLSSLVLTPMSSASVYFDGNEQKPSIEDVQFDSNFAYTVSQELKVNYYLSANSYTTVTVRQGTNVIKTLFADEPQNQGSHNFIWDGKDKYGKFVKGGTYKVAIYAFNNQGSDEIVKTVHVAPYGSTVQFNDYKYNYGYTDDSYNYDWDTQYDDGYQYDYNYYKDGKYYPGYKNDYSYKYDYKNDYKYQDGYNDLGTHIYSAQVFPYSFDPKDAKATVTYWLKENSTVNVKVYTGNKLVKTLLSNASQTEGKHSLTWNGKDSDGDYVDEDVYTVKITAKYGSSQYVKNLSVEVDYSGVHGKPVDTKPVITKDESIPKTFNPYQESAKIFYHLNTGAYATVKIMDGQKTVKVLTDNEYQESGDHPRLWDGQNSAGQYVKEGSYQYVISVDNNKGEDEEQGFIGVDYEGYVVSSGTNKPEIKDLFVSKKEFDPYLGEKVSIGFRLNTDANVDIKVVKDNDKEYVIYSNQSLKAGNNIAYWHGAGFGTGTYSIKVVAKNSKGQDTESTEIKIKKDEPTAFTAPNITNDIAEPIPYNPYNENLKIKFHLYREADVSASIYRGGVFVAQLVNNKKLSEGSHTIYWDGTDQKNKKIENGVYRYVIKSDNNKGKDEETGYFVAVSDPKFTGVVNAVQVMANADYYNYDYNYEQAYDDYIDGYYGPNQLTYNDGAYYPDTLNDGQMYGYVPNVSNQEECGFQDVSKGSKYCDAIKFVKENNIFDGYSDGQFYPNKAIQRDEAVKVVMETFKINSLPVSAGETLGFGDVLPNAWYMPYLKAAKVLGIIDGYPNGFFKPYLTMNRAEFSKIFLEAARSAHNIYIPSCGSKPYADTVMTWYTDYVCYSKDHNLVETIDKFHYQPGKVITRGEAAEFAYNFHKNVGL